MLTMVTRRLGFAALLIVAASALTFALVAAGLGASQRSSPNEPRTPGPTAAMIARIADRLGLNHPLPVRYLLHAASPVGASTPNFFVAAILVIVLSVKLHWLPAFGAVGMRAWILPCATIVPFPACVLSRVVRVNLQEIMSRSFATTALAMGFTRTGVLLREALPNIAVPYLTTFGAQFTLMIIGSVLRRRSCRPSLARSSRRGGPPAHRPARGPSKPEHAARRLPLRHPWCRGLRSLPCRRAIPTVRPA